MTTTTHADGRLPLDVHTRERLREAQSAEGRAVKAVCSAQAAVESAPAKRDSAYLAANKGVERAEHRLTSARAGPWRAGHWPRSRRPTGRGLALVRSARRTRTLYGTGQSSVSQDKTLARIAGLLRQAEGTNNEHEADTYMQAAQRLVSRV